jgi:hypothetical protein
METFTELKNLVDNPSYSEQRQSALSHLDTNVIDLPIVELISSFSQLPYCFTLQCCYGHFVYAGQNDRHSIEPLPVSDTINTIEYRIAYVAFCIENSRPGTTLLNHLKQIPALAPEYIQFGCAEWFWNQQVNSYALQVEPKRHMTKDTCFVDYNEALYIEKVRNQFFITLNGLVQSQLSTAS